MPKPDGYLVESATITPVEIQDGSAFHASMAVRKVGSTGTYRRVAACQVHDTERSAKGDVGRYLARLRRQGLPRRWDRTVIKR